MTTEKREKRKRIGKILLIVFLVLLFLVCLGLLAVTLTFHRYYTLMQYESVDESIPSLTEAEISEILEHLYGNESADSENEMPEDSREALDNSLAELITSDGNSSDTSDGDDVTEETLSNILVIGMDVTDSGQHSRSDAMIVVTVNEKTGRIVLTSLLRDIYLSIPDYPNNRLNASFSFGGVALLQKTIKANFGIDIDRYIAIDFSAFTSIIDLLGGIELTLTEKDCQNVFPDQNRAAGTYTLSGSEALVYARWRKGSDDFSRTERQRTVMTTVINRLLKMSFTELTAVMEVTLPKVRTDLTEADCYSILMNVSDLAKYEIDTAHLPYAGTWEYATIDGKSVLTCDLEENRRMFFENVLG